MTDYKNMTENDIDEIVVRLTAQLETADGNYPDELNILHYLAIFGLEHLKKNPVGTPKDKAARMKYMFLARMLISKGVSERNLASAIERELSPTNDYSGKSRTRTISNYIKCDKYFRESIGLQALEDK